MAHLDLHVNLFDLLAPLARTFDLMDPAIADHSTAVAFWAFRLSEELGMPENEQRDLAVAGMLHDIGAFSRQDRVALMQFESDQHSRHAIVGYLLLKDFPPFAGLAPIVRYHHVPWRRGKGARHNGEAVPMASHLLHLADRVSVLVPSTREVLRHVPRILAKVNAGADDLFRPEFVEALHRLGHKDHVWLEAASGNQSRVLRKALAAHAKQLDLNDLLAFSRLLCRVIDFKSEFTATHTSGLVAASLALSRLLGFSEYDCRLMQIAAYLHDLGKLAVPAEILEKPGQLDANEWHVMRSHVYYTYQVLDPIDAFRDITAWSALHHERLDGSGYPFGFQASELPLGARIMAVADVFTGITEDRPYRQGMNETLARTVLAGMAEQGELDPTAVQALLDHFDELTDARRAAQSDALIEYRSFRTRLDELERVEAQCAA
jgi:HD-GYP domain-containing protein (c-di-GMP phosphodiesterase class II)